MGYYIYILYIHTYIHIYIYTYIYIYMDGTSSNRALGYSFEGRIRGYIFGNYWLWASLSYLGSHGRAEGP